jgi:predicted SnoaL-like aldol condensation-catalyzing enzyme
MRGLGDRVKRFWRHMKSLVSTAAIAVPFLFSGDYACADNASRTAAEQHNLEIVVDFIQNVLTPLKVERFKNYVSPTFIEHTPVVAGNLESLVNYFKKLKEQFPNGLPPSKIVQASVDGDLVTLIVVRETQADPLDSTKKIWKLGIEMIRLKDGKQVEHWDENMIPDPSLSSSPLTDLIEVAHVSDF